MDNLKEKLNQYYDEGLLFKQTHPTLPLTIWNYSDKTQYDGNWDEITLMCRGLVTDDEGKIIARPLKKFFNMEECKHTPTPEFTVTEKLDGSLGILFYYNSEWILATRGSFTSEQAIKGSEILKKYDYKNLPTDCTFLFEIIYPENRIVCQYNDMEELIMLGMVNTKNGDEYCIYDNKIDKYGFKLVKRYDGITDYKVLKDTIKDNEEGYVIRFFNGDRMKIKGVEYLRLHKIMTMVSTTSIWEVLSNGDKIEDIIKDVPDEFYDKVKSYVKELRYFYYLIEEEAGKLFDYTMYGKYNDEEPITDKKEFAIWVQKQKKHLQPILYKMFDKKDYSHYIWKLIKPQFRKL